MSADLKAILRREQTRRAPVGTVKVLIALATAQASDALLERLRKLDVEVDRVLGNKVIGAVPRERLGDLRRDPDVSEVEESVPLERH